MAVDFRGAHIEGLGEDGLHSVVGVRDKTTRVPIIPSVALEVRKRSLPKRMFLSQPGLINSEC